MVGNINVLFYFILMRSFVFSLGFHEDFILRRLNSKSVQPGEPIIVFTGEPVIGAVETAFSSLYAYCKRLGLSNPVMYSIPVSSPAKAFKEVREIVKKLPTDTNR